jgi:hypothetical protein
MMPAGGAVAPPGGSGNVTLPAEKVIHAEAACMAVVTVSQIRHRGAVMTGDTKFAALGSIVPLLCSTIGADIDAASGIRVVGTGRQAGGGRVRTSMPGG